MLRGGKFYQQLGLLTGTERTAAGAWTDTPLEVGYMALWINDIVFSSDGDGGANPWGYVG